MEILKKSDKPLSRSQIAEELGQTPIKISLILNKLLRFKDIECIELDRFKAAKLLGWAVPIRRVRFYFCSS